MRWWLWDEYPYRLVGPAVDLWLGGPRADGRGLDEANGGHSPAPGLTIVSPSSSAPSSSARFLIRDASGAWMDKQAGVLACIGGRVWTGSGWAYSGATDVEARGPMPALTTPGITDTVRRYQSGGSITAADAAGGIIQSYARQVTVAAGDDGSTAPVTPAEVFTGVQEGDFVYTHTIAEYPAGSQWQPQIGIYDSGLPQGLTTFDVDTLSVSAAMSGGAGGIRSLGTGPNGGRLVEYWTGTVVAAGHTSMSMRAYLLRALDTSAARTCWVHNHWAASIPRFYGRIYGYTPCCLVAAGQTPALAAEDLRVTMPWSRPVTLLARVGGTIASDGLYEYVLANTLANTGMFRGPVPNNFRWYPPPITFSSTVDYTAPRTLVTRITGDDTVHGFIDGVLAEASGTNTASLDPTWWIGGQTQYRFLAPLRRVQLWPRQLSPAEVTAAHAQIIASEV